jgi:hypothetical protein
MRSVLSAAPHYERDAMLIFCNPSIMADSYRASRSLGAPADFRSLIGACLPMFGKETMLSFHQRLIRLGLEFIASQALNVAADLNCGSPGGWSS